MATSASVRRQAPPRKYELGDFIETFGTGRTRKKRLTECPLCAVDPHRPDHRFRENESRAAHFETAHGPADV